MPTFRNHDLSDDTCRKDVKSRIAETMCGRSSLLPDEMRVIGAGSKVSPAGWTIPITLTVAAGCFTFDTTACAGTCGPFTKGCCL